MRRALFAASVIAIGLAASAAPDSSAFARSRYPVRASGPADLYCLQGRIWGYPGNCQFATYEQCAVTASGTNSYCGINPVHAFAAQRGYGPSRY
jgi:hypothetical protein